MIRFRITLFLLLLSAFIAVLSSAVPDKIAGFVLDRQTKQPLAGANIQIDGTTLGAISDEKGYFFINNMDPGSYRLRASYIGYKPDTLKIEIDDLSVKNVRLLLKPSMIQLNQVVITGSRQPENLASAAASINVMDKASIQRRGLFRLDEALQYVPGVTMVGENINIRGGSGYNRLGGSRMLVLLDEVPILTSDLGEANWNIVPITEIERMEVLKGAASSLYGSGALSGVVNMITKAPSRSLTLSLRQASGLYDEPSVPEWKWTDKALYFNRTDLSLSRSFGPVGIRLATSYHQSTGDRENGQFERWYVTGKSVVRLPFNASWTLFATYSNEDRDLFLWWLEQNRALNVPPPDRRNKISLKGFVGYTVYNQVFSPQLAGKIRFSYNQQLLALPFNIANAFTPAIGASGEIQLNWKPHSAQSISAGVDYKYDHVESDFYGRRRANSVSPYLQWIWQTFELLQLNAGLRWDNYILVGDSVEMQLSPKMGFSYQPFFGTILHGSFGRGFRAATVVERFISAGTKDFQALPNAQLQPERSTLFDFGLRQSIGENFYAEITGFYNRYENLIEPTLLTSELKAQFMNYPKARIQGIETEIRWRIWQDRLSLQASAMWMDPVELENRRPNRRRSIVSGLLSTLHEEYQAREPLLYRPKFIASFSPLFQWQNLTIGADFRYLSRLRKVAVFPLDERVPTEIWDVRCGYQWTHLQVQFIVRNAMNYNYTVSERVLGEIRNFMLILSTDF